jgi:hypothetical protein
LGEGVGGKLQLLTFVVECHSRTVINPSNAVRTIRVSGWDHHSIHNLSADPPAHAGGSDLMAVSRVVFEVSLWRASFKPANVVRTIRVSGWDHHSIHDLSA